MHRGAGRTGMGFVIGIGLVLGPTPRGNTIVGAEVDRPAVNQHRSPCALLINPDEKTILAFNQTSGTVSFIDLKTTTAKIQQELPLGSGPHTAEWLLPGKTALVTIAETGELVWLELRAGQFAITHRLPVGTDPRALAITPDGTTAFIALAAEDAVAVVDLTKHTKSATVTVGRWPRSLCLSADGTRLAVGCSGSGGVWIVDTASRAVLFERTFKGLNLGQMALTPDGRGVMFPWTFYGQRETSVGSIRQGWVMASRLGNVAFTEDPRPQGLSLDPRRNAVADAQGFAISADGRRCVVALGGSQELAVLSLADLPWTTIGGSDHMDDKLAADTNRFYRIPLGGRPLGVRLTRDGSTAFVANYLANSVQVVSLQERKVVQEIPLGAGSETPARRGEALFYSSKRSLENWYSCHTCHFEGGPNSETIDTFNDGTVGTYKTVPGLYHIAETGPWTWHGRQTDLRELVAKSFATTMRGKEPTAAELDDMLAYFQTIPAPKNPRQPNRQPLTQSAKRGQAIFNSDQAKCAECHAGTHFTDGENHDVKLSRSIDKWPDFNTPSLIGVSQRVRYLHDGRTRSLEELLLGPHSPKQIFDGPELSAEDRTDLIEYLRSL